MEKAQLKINTNLGPVYLVASSKGLTGVFWAQQDVPLVTDSSSACAQILAAAQQQMNEYLDGTRREFTLPLAAEGTVFQQKVWKQLAQIPYGKTCSYKDIARQLGSLNASRAVGTANGKNPLSIIIPCHRVIAADGSLGGYAGGLPIKTQLLNLEKKANKV